MQRFLPLTHGSITLRGLEKKDHRVLRELLLADRAWLSPWEASTPGIRYPIDTKWMVKSLLDQAKRGTGLALVMEFNGEVVGQLNVANILYGSVSSGTIGYWIAKKAAGNSIVPISVAMTIEYLLSDGGLHRVEIDIRPENEASLRVVEKLGLREEGLKQRYIHIDGAWRDHRIFAITSEEISGSMLSRVRNAKPQ
ncbi:MAG: GNAT family N-acetyltransferase [Micrococcales bacterium]|nr:GNAT family N-acetyltransferase [Micrococcales bacterium]